MKRIIIYIFVIATLSVADQPDVVIDKRFIHGYHDNVFDWMIDSVDSWGWGIEVDTVNTGYYYYPTTKIAIVSMGPYIDSLELDLYRNNLHQFVADGGRLLVPLEYYAFWSSWQKDCNNQVLGTGWRLGMNARRDIVSDSLTGITIYDHTYIDNFIFGPPLDTTLGIDVDSLLIGCGPSIELGFPAETILIGNPTTYIGFVPIYPIVIGARSYYGSGEVIIFENNMFGIRTPSDSFFNAYFDTALHYNTQFLRNLLTTPVQPHEERVFRGLPFLLHTQIESLDPTGLFDDMEFITAWIGTLYAWERQVADLGEPFADFLSDSFTFRFVAAPGGDFAVGPVSSDLDSALLTLVFGRQQTPFNWERFLTESDRLHAPWIAPEPMQSLLGIALKKEIEHLAENGHIDCMTYLRTDDCTDSFALSLTDSSVLGFENRAYAFENRTGKPIWILSSAIKHYRSSAMFLETPCWWERYPLCERTDWEYRRRGNLSWSPLASDENADTSGFGRRGFALDWIGDSASSILYIGSFVITGGGTLFVDDSPVCNAMPDTTCWSAMDYWHEEFEMNYNVFRYFDAELRLAITSDSVWTSDVWESPGGIGVNPEPLLQKLPPGETVFPGGGCIDVSLEEIAVYSGDSSSFTVYSLGPETLHVGWICASILDISLNHAVISPGDSAVFFASYDGIALAHDTILIYSDDPQSPIAKVFATALYGIEETFLPNDFSVSVSPNPFNSSLKVIYELPEKIDNLTIEIYNINGSLVWGMEKGNIEAGYYSETWNGTDENGLSQPSGVYLIRMEAGDNSVTQKAILLK